MDATRREMISAIGAAAVAGPARSGVAALARPDPQLWQPPTGLARAEGFATAANGRIYYRRFGTGGRLPLIILHGGPAAAHDYMLAYAQLARDRPVIFYDQSGCGRSSAPAELKRYTVRRYVAELEAVRSHFAIERMLLLGHSWGGLLAPAYAAAHPNRVAGLVLAGSSPDWQGFADAARYWLAALGPQAIAVAAAADRTGRSDDPAFRALLGRYYQQHLCRLAPWPGFLEQAGAALSRNPVYRYLNGPSEFQFSGALARYDGSTAARSIGVPTLITCGEYDEAPPFIAQRLAALIRGARVTRFAALSHMTHIEDPSRVVSATRSFLAAIG